MWFRCSGGNGTGGGATITVTYSSQFYNKTMTCTKGTKTYTKTTTSSGSTVFDVDESGTWTVTCDGTSRTVDVVLEYTTQMAITKTITVYGAASDTISFTDMTGAKTVTTNANGQGSVSITFIPPSANITFTSSKAKNPNNLSQAYSKAITIDTNTTAIYVMPNRALYWYGNEIVTNDTYTVSGYTTVTSNTNNISLTGVTSGGNWYRALIAFNKEAESNSKTAKIIINASTLGTNDSSTGIVVFNSSSASSSYSSSGIGGMTTGLSLFSYDIPEGKYGGVGFSRAFNVALYAFWYE